MSYTVGTIPYDGALGDFNGDGKPDLAVGNNTSKNISVLLGNGDGTFGARTDYDVGQPAYGVVITDLNSDGKLDIVAETSFSLTEGFSVLLGNGNGTFQTRVDYLFPGMAQPKSILASDLNNDTKPDIVVANGRQPSSSKKERQIKLRRSIRLRGYVVHFPFITLRTSAQMSKHA